MQLLRYVTTFNTLIISANFDDNSIPSYFLKEGDTFTIEPILNTGKRHIKQLSDGWTIKTKDGNKKPQLISKSKFFVW